MGCWRLHASIGSIGRVRRGLSRAQRRLRRRPEFGIARAWGCSSRSSERRAQAVATRQQEHIELLREAEVLGGTELAGHGGRRLRALVGQRLQGTRERER